MSKEKSSLIGIIVAVVAMVACGEPKGGSNGEQANQPAKPNNSPEFEESSKPKGINQTSEAKIGTPIWTVYFGISGVNGLLEGKLFAIDGATGKEKWFFEGEGKAPLGNTPAIGPDGTIYVGVSNGAHLFAVDGTTGTNLWTATLGGKINSSPAIGHDGTVYYGAMAVKNDFASMVFALDGKTGEKKWEHPTSNWILSSPAISDDGLVYIGSRNDNFYALDAKNGKSKWSFNLGGDIDSSPAIGSDGSVYVGSTSGVHSLNGKHWKFKPDIGVHSSPAIGADGTVYFGAFDKNVYAVDGKTGAEKWSFETNGWVHNSSPAVGSDGTVYVGSRDKNIYALDGKTGELKWQFETGGWVESSPAIGSDGTLYVGSSGDGKVYAIKTSSTGPADSPWPMFGQNAQRTGRVMK
jgi:outer membrane protein assembly factor BamB